MSFDRLTVVQLSKNKSFDKIKVNPYNPMINVCYLCKISGHPSVGSLPYSYMYSHLQCLNTTEDISCQSPPGIHQYLQ